MTIDARFKDPSAVGILLDIFADIVITANTMKLYLVTNGPNKDHRLAAGLETIGRRCNEGRKVLSKETEEDDPSPE